MSHLQWLCACIKATVSKDKSVQQEKLLEVDEQHKALSAIMIPLTPSVNVQTMRANGQFCFPSMSDPNCPHRCFSVKAMCSKISGYGKMAMQTGLCGKVFLQINNIQLCTLPHRRMEFGRAFLLHVQIV